MSFAESVLHGVVPSLQWTGTAWRSYLLSFRDDIASRFATRYVGGMLDLADLTGTHLHRVGCTTAITSTLRSEFAHGRDLYDYSQQWGEAIRSHKDGVDGIRFVPARLTGQDYAFAVFERAIDKIRVHDTIPLPLVQSANPLNDFTSLIDRFQLQFVESSPQIGKILARL